MTIAITQQLNEFVICFSSIITLGALIEGIMAKADYALKNSRFRCQICTGVLLFCARGCTRDAGQNDHDCD